MAEDDDQDLTALIDGELEEPRRSALMARIENDPALKSRFEALRAAGVNASSAFDRMLADAPLARLRAALPPEPPRLAASTPARRNWGARGFALRELAAGLAIGFLAAAALAWATLGGPPREDEDWRSAVLEYMDLYTHETFAFPAPDAAMQEQQLAAVGGRVGVKLTPDTVAVPGLDYRVAFILGLDGVPLGEIAYIDPAGEPTLFCILDQAAPDAALSIERRGDYTLASWARQGRKFLVIGRLPETKIADFARTLEARL